MKHGINYNLFSLQIRLAYSDGNHYDSVYSTQHMQGMAVCQGEVTPCIIAVLYRTRLVIILADHYLPTCQ